MKEKSYYFINEIPDRNFTTTIVRNQFGQFNINENPFCNALLHIARSGQLFSTSTPFVCSNLKVEIIPDIERNGYTFSDGCGNISQNLADEINRI